jgi:hypothetical protein
VPENHQPKSHLPYHPSRIPPADMLKFQVKTKSENENNNSNANPTAQTNGNTSAQIQVISFILIDILAPFQGHVCACEF